MTSADGRAGRPPHKNFYGFVGWASCLRIFMVLWGGHPAREFLWFCGVGILPASNIFAPLIFIFIDRVGGGVCEQDPSGCGYWKRIWYDTWRGFLRADGI